MFITVDDDGDGYPGGAVANSHHAQEDDDLSDWNIVDCDRSGGYEGGKRGVQVWCFPVENKGMLTQKTCYLFNVLNVLKWLNQ